MERLDSTMIPIDKEIANVTTLPLSNPVLFPPNTQIDPSLSSLPVNNFNMSTDLSPPSVDQFLSFTQDYDCGFGSWEAFAASDANSPEKLFLTWDWTRTEELANLARNEMSRNTPFPMEQLLQHDTVMEQYDGVPRSDDAPSQDLTAGNETSESDHPLRKAYEESAFYWHPHPNDNVEDTTSMSNLLTLVEAAKDHSAVQLPSAFRQQTLSTGDRDRVLALIYQCQSRNRGVYDEKDVPIFPSSVVFDWFIQLYFQHFHPQNPILHLPTFDPRTTETVLLLAIITAGGFFAPHKDVQKFAYGLAEILRRYMGYHFEADNSRARQLQSMQAHHICLLLGCWSGNRRAMELTEAIRCTIIAMFRRGGLFSKSGYKNLPIARIEENEQEWQEWVKEEGKKRLVYFHLFMECQMGVFYDVSSCFSYAELSAPLLFSEELWKCNSARQWAMRWNEEVSNGTLVEGKPQPGFTEFLREFLGSPQTLSNNPFGGNTLSHNFVLMSLFLLIWELNQLQSVMDLELEDQQEGFPNTSVTARRQELERLLKVWEKSHQESPVDDDVGVELYFHTVCINLYANLHHMRVFTGREDHNGGRRVYPQLLRWRMGSSSRRALWHAGQIVRISRERSIQYLQGSRLLWGPAAIHQACLVLWCYGILSAIRQEQLRRRSHLTIPIRVDGADQSDPDVKAFLDFGEGEPCLSGFDEATFPLDSPQLIALECAEILDTTVAAADSRLLAENIAKVLRTLGNRTETFKRWLKKGLLD